MKNPAFLEGVLIQGGQPLVFAIQGEFHIPSFYILFNNSNCYQRYFEHILDAMISGNRWIDSHQ